ncbi:hypothetical protein V9T40_002815 [Parthenolecanium corni]|uniref:BHLH domain-containing protein n=1 Tax=Parthenolecanium corni TaxID=536013 RepID=A0AAN9TGU6_9HEMI
MSTLDPEEKLKFEELMIRYEQDDISGSCSAKSDKADSPVTPSVSRSSSTSAAGNPSNAGCGAPATVDEKRIRREIANSNERRRMQSINAGFQSLRALLPHHVGEKLSKGVVVMTGVRCGGGSKRKIDELAASGGFFLVGVAGGRSCTPWCVWLCLRPNAAADFCRKIYTQVITRVVLHIAISGGKDQGICGIVHAAEEVDAKNKFRNDGQLVVYLVQHGWKRHCLDTFIVHSYVAEICRE